MKKHFSVKPLIIAAAVSATAIASIATANAATDGAIMDGITKTFTFMFNGHEVEGEYEYNSFTTEDGVSVTELTVSVPEDVSGTGITIGTNGDEVYVIDEDGNITHIPALPLDEGVDTTPQ